MTEKLYWEDAYQTQFDAHVKQIEEKGVILDKTLFYPESGNQASDRGYLVFGEHKFEVDKVTKENDEILHHISSDFKKIINVGDNINGEIDWDYRYGIMKAHTSQHIFSAVFKNKYNIDTLRAILNFEEVFLQVSQKIDHEQLKEILLEVNKICNSKNLRLNARIVSDKELKTITNEIRSTIPDESNIRLIEIDNLDLVCCGGTHIKNTTEIGNLFIYEFKKGNEIRYTIGKKALEMASKYNIDIIDIANNINSPVEQLNRLLKKRLELLDNLQEQNKNLSFKLLESISKTPTKKVNNLSLFYIDVDVDIKILNKSLENFPSDSLIIVKFEGNKIRILSLNEALDSNQILQQLVKKFGGRGGGNPKSSQGFLENTPDDIMTEIEILIQNK
ncbi:MAG: alanyl-tRNA editing protein [Candidatus Hermodarchaeota archaeon]